jgi:membrane fusion protein, multidrug efflux system
MNSPVYPKKHLLTLGALLLLLVQLGCHKEEHHEHERVELVVTSPLKQDTELQREYVAQIHAIQHIEVRAIERGYLQDIFVDEGQTVKKGDRLFQIMPMLYQAELQRSSAEAEFAQIEYKNTDVLRKGNVVSANELAMAKAKLDKANAEKALAAAHLSLTVIRAPFDGIVNRLHARKGSLMEEGELLTTLADNSELWVYFNVTEAEYLDYKTNKTSDEPTPVKLMMANNKLFDQTGLIKTIEADFHNETGNIAFRATFPNPKGLLKHGETGKILMSRMVPGALLIPQKATFEILDKRFVYVLDAKNTVHSRPITVEAELPHLYLVSKGLQEGDKILVEGLRKVRDGDEITPNYKDPATLVGELDVPAE